MAVATTHWHAVSAAETVARLGSGPQGLSAAEADRRLRELGPNQLAPPHPASALAILAQQFRGVVVLLLLSAGVLSFAMGDRLDAVAIGAVIAINAILGFTLELRARRAMEALTQLGAARATVMRDGRLTTIDAASLVPGDLIDLAAGQTVPADARVVEETDLRTNEAALTGESLPVSKQAMATVSEDTSLADRTNMVYRGTTVSSGVARAAVTATGDATEVGRIGVLTRSVEEGPTPLERRLDALGRRLVWVTLGVALLVGLLGVLQGAPWALMLETSIALAVAAVPEGLPAVATIALAVGLRRMARRHALVRRLSAVESLGSTTVICTDKTRTLTTGEMAVTRCLAGGHASSFPLSPEASADERHRTIALLTTAAAASRQPVTELNHRVAASDDPVDSAVRLAAEALEIQTASPERTPRLQWIPFSSERRYAASFEPGRAGGFTAYVKGAPQTVLDMCGSAIEGRGVVPLGSPDRARLMAENERLAAEGLRVLGVARGNVSGVSLEHLRDLVFAGFIGLSDPPAPGVRESVARLHAAGLRILMLTGDQQRTAEAIGRQLGVLSALEVAIDSRAWRAMPQTARDESVARAAAFSRVSAEDKLTIVAALQAHDEIVAMLGDGVNDAPALRRADVGIAMGMRGTDVAREAAAIVLQDDRFETIAAAVEEGRIIGDNIRKCVFYLFSCNLAEVLVLLVAGVFALPVPLRPLQILWINLVTDTFPALALAMEPGDPDVMRRAPADPHQEILSPRSLRRVVSYAGLILAGTMAALHWGLRQSHQQASTMAFMTLAFAQILHLGNARSDHPVLRPAAALSNPYALLAVALAGLLQILPVAAPALRDLLDVTPLTLTDWAVVGVCASLAAVVGQSTRVWRART